MKKNKDILKLSGITEKETLKSFANKRKSSAFVIANSAKEKGGIAVLTEKHFEVKLPIYEKAFKSFDKEDFKKQYESLVEELSSKKIEDMKQIDFQMLVGKIEVVGELLIKNEDR
jgi:hypothetical protein